MSIEERERSEAIKHLEYELDGMRKSLDGSFKGLFDYHNERARVYLEKYKDDMEISKLRIKYEALLNEKERKNE